MVDSLFFSRCCSSSTTSLRYSSSWISRLRHFALLGDRCRDNAATPQIVSAATSQKITSSTKRARSAVRVAEIDGDAEHAARQRRQDAEPKPADGGREEHGRDIGREENVGPDLRQSPARKRREQQAEGRKIRRRTRSTAGKSPASRAGIRRSASSCANSARPADPKYGRAAENRRLQRLQSLASRRLEPAGNIGSNDRVRPAC